MDQKLRRQHPPAFKAKVALEAIKEQKTIAELASQYGVHPTQITKWKKKALDGLSELFSEGQKNQLKQDDELIQQLYNQVGKLQVERDWLKKRLASLRSIYSIGVNQLKLHIEKPNSQVIDNQIVVPSITEQAKLLGIARSSVYYREKPVDPYTLAVMNRIDEIYTKRPFYGVRKVTNQLHQEGLIVNHKKVHNLMQVMGIQAIYPKKNLSKNDKPHPVYPYLLSGVKASHPNHIWGTDITYIRLAKGFVYLVAFLDWYSRFILSWRLSTTLEELFVIEAAKDAILKFGLPDITNSDQGVQFTAIDYLNIWLSNNVQISMDGRGRAMDNIFTERLWRTIKYEEVYLKAYESVTEARNGIGEYIDFYNNERFHQSLKNQTPKSVYDKKRN